MKPALVSVVLLLLATLSYADDGWQRVKWGMSVEQVKEAYPAALKLPKQGLYMQNGVSYVSPLRLPEYRLAGRQFFVDFLFDAQAKVAGTVLGTESTNYLARDTLAAPYRDLKALLTERYGDPTSVTPRGDGGENAVWIAGGTEIRLNHTVSERLNFSGIRLLYLQIRKSGSDTMKRNRSNKSRQATAAPPLRRSRLMI